MSADLPSDPLDTNRKYDVYVIKISTDELQLVSRHAGSADASNGDSFGPLVSEDGRFVAFNSYASNLHLHDYNGELDVFLAEIKWDLPALAGDYNLDGYVDAADYALWRNAMGQTGLVPYSGADGSGNGSVGPEDYTVWKRHFGESLPVGGGAAASVTAESPEESEVKPESTVQAVTIPVTGRRKLQLPVAREAWATRRNSELAFSRSPVDARIADAVLTDWFASRRVAMTQEAHFDGGREQETWVVEDRPATSRGRPAQLEAALNSYRLP